MSRSPSAGVVERLLAERIGLDPSSVGEALIARGVKARMQALGLRSTLDYEKVVLEQKEEVQALVEEVVVSESWFFRDDRPFEVLSRYARTVSHEEPGRAPLSILSIPCAGGEEPYSIAMTLLEAGLPIDKFRVDGVDISARALTRAIAGVYGSNAFRGTVSSLRSTYFREQNGVFTLDLAVRSTVRFHVGNLLDPTLFADRPPFDVVFCRNVLIYLDDEARVRAFASLGRLIADDGLLFLGHADRVDQPETSLFVTTGDQGGFAFRKGDAKPRSKPVPATRKKVTSFLTSPSKASPPQPPVALPQASTPPLKPLALGPEPEPESLPDQILDQASSLADSGRYDEAIALIERLIFEGGATARAFFLLGLIDQAAGFRDRSEAHYLKAIYLDAQHDEALLALAVLARRKGDLVAESTYRRRAQRVMSRKVVP